MKAKMKTGIDEVADDMESNDDVCSLRGEMDKDKVRDDVESASAHVKRGPPLKDKGVNIPLYANPRSKRHSRALPFQKKPAFQSICSEPPPETASTHACGLDQSKISNPTTQTLVNECSSESEDESSESGIDDSSDEDYKTVNEMNLRMILICLQRMWNTDWMMRS